MSESPPRFGEVYLLANGFQLVRALSEGVQVQACGPEVILSIQSASGTNCFRLAPDHAAAFAQLVATAAEQARQSLCAGTDTDRRERPTGVDAVAAAGEG